MIPKSILKKEITSLIKKYELMRKNKSSYSEADIQTKLIKPLFFSLGWDIEGKIDSNEVKEEKPLKDRKRADLIFSLDYDPRLVVESKKLIIDLCNDKNERKKSIEQAAIYGHTTEVSCTVLTNFEYFIIIDSEKKYDIAEQTIVWEFSYNELLNDETLERLLTISKEGFKKNQWEDIIKKEFPKREIKTPVNEQLLSELLRWRFKLSKYIKNKYPKYSKKERLEIVQIILNRFIFIKRCESKNYVGKNRLVNLTSDFGKEKLRTLFDRINKIYDGKLFKEHECDKIKMDSAILQEISADINWSRENKNIKYDFSAMSSDILGKMYEKYLGYISDGDENIKEISKKKEEGIYYTQKYIVDYILKNTLGHLFKQGKPLSKIKILDPACGSGSFLVGAYEFIEKNYYKDIKLGYNEKKDIIENNLYGVDKDFHAVEIARLSLYFKILEKNKKLPKNDNLKIGNSLVEDLNVDDNAFEWDKQFKEVMDDKGFDIVIGNPPYIKARGSKGNLIREYINKKGKFKTLNGMWDMYVPFVEKGITLLKPDGLFGMIIPDTIGVADYTQKLTRFIIKDYSLYQIDFFPDLFIFPGVGIKNKIIFVKNSKSINKCKKILHDGKLTNTELISNSNNDNVNSFRLFESKIDFNFENSISLKNICYVSYGARFNNLPNGEKFEKSELISNKKDKIHNQIYTEGKYLERYKIKKELYVEWGTKRCPKKLVRPTFQELYTPKKILMSREKRIVAFSDKGHVCDNTIIVGVPYHSLKGVYNRGVKKYYKNVKLDRNLAEKTSLMFDLKYLMGILNSKLIAYFLKFKSGSKIDSYPDDWKEIPIKNASETKQKRLVNLVDNLIKLIEKKNNSKEDSEKEDKLEKSINETNKRINNLVYELYNLNEKEISIIEKEFI